MRGSGLRLFSWTPQTHVRAQGTTHASGSSVGRLRPTRERNARRRLAAVQSDAAAPRERKVRLRLAVFESDAAAPHGHKVRLRIAAVLIGHRSSVRAKRGSGLRQFSRTPHTRARAQTGGNSVGHRSSARMRDARFRLSAVQSDPSAPHERKAWLRLSAVQSDAAATRESAMCSLVCRQFNLSPQTRAHARL